MKLVSIFVNEEGEGLYAIQYDGEEVNEFNRLLSLWSNPQYVRGYLNLNQQYLKNDFFAGMSFADLNLKIVKESRELDDHIYDIEEKFYSKDLQLQEIFRPLSNGEYTIPVYQKTKTSLEKWQNRTPFLRFYAIRITDNFYVITGGAIKLVKKMEDHPDTKYEIEIKFPMAQAFLATMDLLD